MRFKALSVRLEHNSSYAIVPNPKLIKEQA
jgi:hypothetical protein